MVCGCVWLQGLYDGYMPSTTTSKSFKMPPFMEPLLWGAGAAVSFILLFFLITFVLKYFPAPIGDHAEMFTEGAQVTLKLTIVSSCIGLFIGVIAGIQKTSQNWFVVAPASLFVWIVRGTPLLIQILFVYNVFPQLLGYVMEDVPQINAFWSAVIALSLNVGAYNAEVIRAGILAVARGQTEAARSLGLSGRQAMMHVILPQALRIVVPPLVNNIVALLKDSSLASVIALLEISLVGQRITSETFQPMPILTTVAVVYLTLTTVLTFFTDIMERRLKLATR